ncbi:Glutamyl/glutaminyl-tRNA synthetase class Ib [Penicillium atrosanguineum]|uniref:Glutamyl/glutaminyl-tRNA synthetase class Ib n=1 Tax=Penicillium atrosanguineum TaxID=1132637 RepID=UPI0023878DA5|nr:Glutamyl/glutaminyl-tRNA synthetase class Ib [Penicillium atrosanguineum]KAJ5304262.1 Glutamyl/glutaminyl-tRNA synthetase class Ib [Penicillium atrosanguineum]
MSDPKPVEIPVAEPKGEAVEATEPEIRAPATENTDKDVAPKADEPTKDETPKLEEPAQEAISAPAAPAAAPESEAKLEEQKPQKPAYLTNIPSLEQFFDHLPELLSKTGYEEMWGVSLKNSEDIPTVNVLIKFLRANEGDLQAAEEQLRKALEWRKETKPLELVESGRYSASKFGGLGYLTTYEEDGRPLVFTWNIYGAVKDMTATFADADEFVKWRAALMEMAVQDLNMKNATSVIDYDGENDPYQMIQVHDYLNVKFFRMDPAVRTASKKVIDVFSTAYPELLREKFFINVPSIMGWMFSAMKLILSRNTTRKFHPISNGANLAREFTPALSEKIPKAYGGKGADLKDEGRTVPLIEDEEEKEETKPTKAAKETTFPETPAQTEEPTKTEEAAKAGPARRANMEEVKEGSN